MTCVLEFSDGEVKTTYQVLVESRHLKSLLNLERAEREMAELEEAVDNGALEAYDEIVPPNEEDLDHILKLPELKKEHNCWVISLMEQLLEEKLDVTSYTEDKLAILINTARNLGFDALFDELSYMLACRLRDAEDLNTFLGVEQDAPSEEELATRRRNCGF